MLTYILRSLAIKQRYIEIDEFDRGPRNVFNLGHSFGHAIEAATNFEVPHGIAVTIGMDVALEVAFGLGLTEESTVTRMRPVLRQNAADYGGLSVPMGIFFKALCKDKKNISNDTVTVILPLRGGKIETSVQPFNDRFRALCSGYFDKAVT